MIATISKDSIRIGQDFVHAQTGTPKSHGWIELCKDKKDYRYTWQSTENVGDSEKLLRAHAAIDGFAVTTFMSQACQVETLEQCPKCKSKSVDRFHHAGTFALPECYYQECLNCNHQWNHG